MLSYIIVGSGYRAEYFGRIAAAYPSLFRAMYLCRSEEKAALMKARTGMEATTSRDACVSFRPDFVVIAVDWAHVADVAEEWLDYPVVTETPVGNTLEKLNRLWSLHRQGAKIVCCEQYHRYPILAAGLTAIQEGKIGEPSSLYISLCHDYHAASLIRKALRISGGEAYTLRGERKQSPVVQTDSRTGAITDGSVSPAERTILHITFASGKTAIYDFASVEYRSFIRSRHLTVRGERGEWSDCVVYGLDEKSRPQRVFLLPEIAEKYERLDTQALRDLRKTWHPELFLDTAQDEFAITSILLDMEDYLHGGPSPYPLQDALDDARFLLAMEEAVRQPWKEVTVHGMPWWA